MQINRSIYSVACLLLMAGTLKAQISQVSLPTKASTTSGAPATQSPAYQLAVKVRRVVVDVVVTDGKGNPVEGLKQNDFKVTEDGAIQPIHFFDVHGGLANSSQQALSLHLPANTYSNLALAPSDKPVTILVYDLLNTPQEALPRSPGNGGLHPASKGLNQNCDLRAVRPPAHGAGLYR